MNEPLRRALARARLREVDVAAHLGVDPKTVRRWIDGRIPYPNNRVALAEFVGADEGDLWPDADGLFDSRTHPEELAAVYPHRWAVPREVWQRFFESAQERIDILAYAALWLAEDTGLLAIIEEKANHGVRVRIALGDPDSDVVTRRGHEEGIGDAMPAKARNALSLFCPLATASSAEIRVHQTVLYSSIYRGDGQIFVNQHVYSLPASQAPVFKFQSRGSDEGLHSTYLANFEKIWATSTSVNQ